MTPFRKLQLSMLLFAVLTQLTYLPAFADGRDIKPVDITCISALAEARQEVTESVGLATRFAQYRYEELPGHTGFTLKYTSGPAMSSRTVHMERVDEDLGFIVAGGFEKIWRYSGQEYGLVNVGFKNFQGHSMRVNEIVLNHLQVNFGKNLKVYFDPVRQTAEDLLRVYRWSFHDKVLDIYHERKPYLSDGDFQTLEDLNAISGNSDVFGLLTVDPKLHTMRLTRDEVQKRLGLTIQLSYFGDHNYFRPTLRGVLEAAGLPTFVKKDEFPFEYRLEDTKSKADFRQDFEDFFDIRRTGEIVRYSSFMKLPRPIRDRFVLNVLDRAIERKLRYIVISVDESTSSAFSVYGFSRYAQLPTRSGEKEYLDYVQIGSADFNTAYSRLKEQSASVETVREGM